jgi:hypothetical protein
MAIRQYPYSEDPLTQRIVRLMSQEGLSDNALGLALGITNISRKFRMQKGRGWTPADLKKISQHFGIPWPLILQEPFRAPLLQVQITKEGVDLKAFANMAKSDYYEFYLPIHLSEGVAMDAKFYCMKITDDNLVPAIYPGSILFVQEDSWGKIKENSLVVWRDSANRGHVARVDLSADQLILLHPAKGTILEKLPPEYIRQCDKVLWTKEP